MGVRKIFIVLVTIVACVILGAFVLNTLMPNTVKSISSATEDMIFKATGMGLDLNGDGTAGSAHNGAYSATVNDSTAGIAGGNTVTGYK